MGRATTGGKPGVPMPEPESADTRTTRVVRLLLWMLARGSATKAEVARHLGVEPRLAREDLHLLAGIVDGLHTSGQGRNTRWIVDPTMARRHLGVLDRVSLLLGRELASFLEGTALHDGIDRVGRDAEAVIRGRWDRNLSRKLRALHEPGRSYTDRTEVLDTVLDALLRERGLRLQYGADPSAARWLEPQQALTLVLYRRALYLLARPAEGGPTRRLSVTKIHAALLDGPLPYPTDWDPDAELRGWFGIHAGGRRGHIVIDFAPEVAHYVAARRWGEDQVLRPTTGGGIRLEMDSGGPELVRWVLEWGDRARVVGPDWLREEVRAQLGRACALYDQEVVPWS